MNRFEKHIALKPFLESISDDCSQLTREELTKLILELAQSEPASERGAFLQKLRAFLPYQRENTPKTFDIQSLLNEIQGLKEDIEERIACIKRGDYEDLDDYDWEYSRDDDPDYMSEDQIESLDDLFQHASNFFLNHSLHDAKKMYHDLFNIFYDIDEFDSLSYYLTVNIREERARYARCVYDAPNGENFLEEFSHAIMLKVHNKREVHILDDNLPLLQDVIDSRKEEMQGLQSFYPKWITFLEGYELNARTASLLIEAVHHLEGREGVAKMARAWGNDQRYGYLFWLGSLFQTSDLEDLIQVGGEALEILEPGNAREIACDHLIEAGKILGNVDCVLKGYRQKVFSNPTDQNLLALLNEAWSNNAYRIELNAILMYWSKQTDLQAKKKPLYIKSLLLAGKIDHAFDLVRGETSFSWFYGGYVGLVFATIGLLLVKWSENASILRKILLEYAYKKYMYSFESHNEIFDKGYGFYEFILSSKDWVHSEGVQTNEYWKWVLSMGRDCIEHIVSHKHRSAYERAAQVLGALAEIYTARDEKNMAKQIIREYCHEKYNRHVAFKREVQGVLKTSGYTL